MNIEKLEALTGLRQSPLSDILHLELDLIPQLYQLPDGKAIVSKLVIRGGFEDWRAPVVFEYYGSRRRKWSRGGWEAGAVRKKVKGYRTEEEVTEAFKNWSRQTREELKPFKI